MAGDSPYWNPKTETLKRERLSALQLAKLRYLCEWAAARSPWYRRQFEASAFGPSQLRSLDDIRRIPMLTRDQWMASQEAVPPYGEIPTVGSEGAIRVHTTSGTTGRGPLRALDSRKDWAWIAEMWAYAIWGCGSALRTRRTSRSATCPQDRCHLWSVRHSAAASRHRSRTGSATRLGSRRSHGAISSYDDVNTIVLAGRADLCALARPHLYDPHWTLHAAAEQDYDGVQWVPQYQARSRRPPSGREDRVRKELERAFDPGLALTPEPGS